MPTTTSFRRAWARYFEARWKEFMLTVEQKQRIYHSVADLQGTEIVYNSTNDFVLMEGGHMFTTELLQLMLKEERQKFVTRLGTGASWRELNVIRKNINQINKLLDDSRSQQGRNAEPGRHEPNSYSR